MSTSTRRSCPARMKQRAGLARALATARRDVLLIGRAVRGGGRAGPRGDFRRICLALRARLRQQTIVFITHSIDEGHHPGRTGSS